VGCLVGCDDVFDLEHVDPEECEIDEFAGTTLDLVRWETRVNNVEVAVEAGQLVVRPPAMLPEYNGVTTTRPFDLGSGGVSIEIVQLLNQGPAEVQLLLTADPNAGDAYFEIFATTSYLGLRKQVGAVRDEQSTIPSPAARFWRISFAAGMAMFETSPTGEYGTWVVRHETPVELPTNELFVRLAAGTYDSGLPSPGEARFDNVKICPSLAR